MTDQLKGGSAQEERSEREALRLTFGRDAERYDRMRPSYPARLFDDLAELACIGPSCRVLEIGVGTGQATLALAERGCQVVGVELSPGLAAVARRNLNAFPNVRIAAGAFEDWTLPNEPFDTVLSATAFHWIDPEVRVGKAADALRPGGALATIDTHHVAGGSEEFFAEVQDCYERWDPATEAGLRLPTVASIPSNSEEIDQTGRFEPAVVRRHEREIGYSTTEYRDLLLTYSGHIVMEPAAREGLLSCIQRLMDSRYGGRITKRYLIELRVTNKGR
ncbi:MAG: class I SAM-dependent methyltransferase [Candidatus Limnocylindrales bacterium]